MAHKLSDMRNQISHRQPLGPKPDAAALLYQQFATNRGLVPNIRPARFKRDQEVADGEAFHHAVALLARTREVIAS